MKIVKWFKYSHLTSKGWGKIGRRGRAGENGDCGSTHDPPRILDDQSLDLELVSNTSRTWQSFCPILLV